MNQDKLKCKNESLLITQEMDNLGFTMTETKSVLIPTQRLEFFWVIIDTVLFKVFLTEAKLIRYDYNLTIMKSPKPATDTIYPHIKF